MKQAIDSVLSQTCPNFSLIICEDCGPESVAAARLVRQYSDQRLRFVPSQTNLGLAGNWNRCLELATTDLVTILHADDRLLPNYTESMLKAAAADKDATAFFCRAKIIGSDGRSRFSPPDFYKRWVCLRWRGGVILSGDAALAALLRGWFITCPTLCYRKSKLGDLGFLQEWRQVADVDLIASLLLAEHSLVGLPTVAYAYRRHAANETALLTESMRRFHEEVAIYNQIKERAEARGWRQTALVAANKHVIKLNLFYCAVRDLLRFRLHGAMHKLRFARAL